jgi:hypothetical protein
LTYFFDFLKVTGFKSLLGEEGKSSFVIDSLLDDKLGVQSPHSSALGEFFESEKELSSSIEEYATHVLGSESFDLLEVHLENLRNELALSLRAELRLEMLSQMRRILLSRESEMADAPQHLSESDVSTFLSNLLDNILCTHPQFSDVHTYSTERLKCVKSVTHALARQRGRVLFAHIALFERALYEQDRRGYCESILNTFGRFVVHSR